MCCLLTNCLGYFWPLETEQSEGAGGSSTITSSQSCQMLLGSWIVFVNRTPISLVISVHKLIPLPPQSLFHLSSFSPTFSPSSTSLFHSCQFTRNRQSTLLIIWFVLWSRSCAYHRTKENFQRNISNCPLNSKSLHNHRYLPFHFKIIHNQPTVKTTFTQ